MDAIKKHRFWILLGLAVPMILYGYIAANASLREATAKREDEIKKVESSIPPSSKPNGRFAEGLKAVNEKHKAQVNAALGSLWGEQAKMMVWPSIVASRIPKKYRDEILLQPRFAYKNEYPSLWEKLFYSLEPMVPETIRGTTHTQKVFVEPSALTVSVFAPNQPPSSEEVWDAQEDLWLMQMLADAIRTTNKYADGPANATVRSIEAFKLLGGTGTAVPKAVMGAAGSGGAEAMAAMPMGPMGPGQAITSGGAMINPAEEFGPDVDGAAGGGDMMSAAAAMPSAGGPTAIKRIRYIGATDKEFKERGFYLRVVISQMKIPEFLTTLTNCPWPVRIVRFNMSPNPHEKPFLPGSSMGPESYPMATSGGYEGAGAFGANPFGGGPGGLPEGGSPGGYDPSGYGGGGGGITSILAADAAGAANIIPGFMKVPDKFGALQHPDLIQLDVLGAITIYNPPATDAVATDAAAEATPMGTTPMDGTTPADPMAATTPSADPMATPASDPMAATPAATPATPAEGTPAPAATVPAGTDPAKPEEGAPAPAAPASDPAAPDAKPAAPPADAPAPATGENPGTPAAPPPSN